MGKNSTHQVQYQIFTPLCAVFILYGLDFLSIGHIGQVESGLVAIMELNRIRRGISSVLLIYSVVYATKCGCSVFINSRPTIEQVEQDMLQLTKVVSSPACRFDSFPTHPAPPHISKLHESRSMRSPPIEFQTSRRNIHETI